MRTMPVADWVLAIKPAVPGDIPLDVRNYAARHAAFPNEPTTNQLFSDSQWESYRMLGWFTGMSVFAQMP